MRLVSELWSEFALKLMATILAPALLAVAYYLLRESFLAFQALRLVRNALKAVGRRQENTLWVEGPGFWLKRPIVPPESYIHKLRASIPILMIATLKGGVGKTTLAGSLAAHFAMRWRNSERMTLRVLLVDLDFQGSLSTMTVADERRFVQPSKANMLISGELGDGLVRQVAEPVTSPGMRAPLSIATLPAYYDLAQAENRTLIEWLLPLSDLDLLGRLFRLFRLLPPKPPRSKRDVRYLLAEAFLDPQVQTNFDLVIIDAPPRLTTAHVQAMCASTHLLIPTILDGLSGDAVARYIDQIASHKLGPDGDARSVICPQITPLGVACTMVPNNRRDLSGDINLLSQRLAAARLNTQVLPQECFIHHRPLYRESAGSLIAYAAPSEAADYRELREEVDSLGDHIAPLMGAAGRHTYAVSSGCRNQRQRRVSSISERMVSG
jgi:chromosome partitioning protein